MITTAILRHLHIAPRKVRLVADLIRGKGALEAQTILSFTVKRAAGPILKLLNSAIANAKNNFQLDPANLYISKITVDEGPKVKRWRARARGSANEIQKKTSHVNLSLEEITKSKKSKIKKIEKTASVKVGETALEESGRGEGDSNREKSQKQERPKSIKEARRPAVARGIQKIFRRKAF